MLCVEALRPDLIGHTTICLLEQGTAVNAVGETTGSVNTMLGSLMAAEKHDSVSLPLGNTSTVQVLQHEASHAHPNVAVPPNFWVLLFVDHSVPRMATFLLISP